MNKMMNCFVLGQVRAIADLVPYSTGGMLLTRINVPAEFRGKGFGRQLLKDILDEADRTGTTLHLWPAASGGLNQDALEDWYKRNGFFDQPDCSMTREPRRGYVGDTSDDSRNRGCDPIGSYLEYEQEASPAGDRETGETS